MYLTKKIILVFSMLFSLAEINYAQSSLEKYIEAGLKNNLVLQQKKVSLDKAVYSLKIANSFFYPAVSIIGDYQSGDGGRNIQIPLGDMMNPVYSTLNQLTMSNAFPQIKNVETNFLPNNYYDAKIRTSVSVFSSDLIFNRKIQKQQIILQEFEVEIYKSELIKNIKVAYYNYLSAVKLISIYEHALILAKEGKKINESLKNNGKSVTAYVARSESEIQNLEAKKTTAQQQMKNAGMYFNFLINAKLNQNIDTSNSSSFDPVYISQHLLNDAIISNRDEIKAIETTTLIYEQIFKMNKTGWLPRLTAFLDLGSQASDWKYNAKSQYYFFGVQLNIPLFVAGRQTYKTKQAKLDLENQKVFNTNAVQQIQLSAEIAKSNLKSSYENYLASIKQSDAIILYYKLIEKGYKEGVNTFIETIDARNQFTAAILQVVLNKYQLLSALACYEREINKK